VDGSACPRTPCTPMQGGHVASRVVCPRKSPPGSICLAGGYVLVECIPRRICCPGWYPSSREAAMPPPSENIVARQVRKCKGSPGRKSCGAVVRPSLDKVSSLDGARRCGQQCPLAHCSLDTILCPRRTTATRPVLVKAVLPLCGFPTSPKEEARQSDIDESSRSHRKVPRTQVRLTNENICAMM
jgi:hypothetical protein